MNTIRQLFDVTEYAVFLITDDPVEDDPLIEGTYGECLQYVEENPGTTLVWYDEDHLYAPSLEFH